MRSVRGRKGGNVNRARVADSRQLLVERIAASPVVGKSNRLRDLLLYLADRALAGDVAQIHEQEVGHHVFGRARNPGAEA